ncbi:MAG TPA: DHH family phosphoesterase [Trueperaceae bacterium]|nr:DHH family phosphoesterase [Trueperaceae bacterium]
MTRHLNQRGETDYPGKLATIGEALKRWNGPVVLVSHVDPDGDAFGSTLALKRALDSMGKDTVLPLDPPSFLAFLARDGELSPPLAELPRECLLLVLDAADKARAVGAPLAGADMTINIDHHGTNDRFGDLALVEPGKAATAMIVKDLLDTMRFAWNVDVATPCLTGILTDTGNFRFGNTDRSVLETAGALIDVGVPYAELTDRLQWRHPDYFKMLGEVMKTVGFHLDGRLVTARLTDDMRARIGESDDDSDDYVGLIRYAEGSKVAAVLKERPDGVKLSVRSRDGVSAQAICVELGGGGHVAAAGATVHGDLDEAERRLIAATARELARHGAEAG